MQGPKKEIILSERKAQQSESMRMLNLGATVRGIVVAVEEYGAFVELIEITGVSGLIHKTELSWDAVMTVDAVLTKGGSLVYRIQVCGLGTGCARIIEGGLMALDSIGNVGSGLFKGGRAGGWI